MLVEADDEAADPNEDQEGEEDGDEDGVADAGHGDLVRPGAGHGSWLSPVASSHHNKCMVYTAHSSHTTIEVRGSLTGLPIMFWAVFENSLEQ